MTTAELVARGVAALQTSGPAPGLLLAAMAFCEALDLEKPIIMGCSMGGNVCLPLALNYENELTALIAVEACDHSPGWWIDPLHHPHIHGGEVCATSVFGLMAPQSTAGWAVVQASVFAGLRRIA